MTRDNETNLQIAKVMSMIAPELEVPKSKDVKMLKDAGKTISQMAYCLIYSLDAAFKSKAPEQLNEKKWKHWYADSALVTTASKLGRMILTDQSEMSERMRETKNFRAGYYVLHSLVLSGLLEFVKDERSRAEYRIKCVKGKEKELTDIIGIIDVVEPIISLWSRPLFSEPKPFTHFYHQETGERLIHKCQENIREEILGESMESVFDVINENIKTPYRINTTLLDVYNEMSQDPLFTFSYKVDLTATQLEGLERERDKVLKIANLVGDRKFWEGAFYDFRGRIYPTTHYLSHAGCKLSKSLFLFDEAKPLGKDGWRWLLIHAANCWGEDKGTLDERVEFANSNVMEWTGMGQDLLTNDGWKQAEDPFNFAAACVEIFKARTSGNKFEYESGLPIAIDATCSGLQILSALAKDRKGAELSNLTKMEKKGDYYKMVADHVWKEVTPTAKDRKDAKKSDKILAKFKSDIQIARENENWEKLEELKTKEKTYMGANRDKIDASSKVFWEERTHLGRKVCKRPCMTYFYSCQANSMALAVLDDFQNDMEFQGLLYSHARWLTNRIYDACRELMPAATSLMDLFVRIGGDFGKENKDFVLDAPLTGFRFRQDYRIDSSEQVKVKYKSRGKLINPRVVVGKAVRVDTPKVRKSVAPNVVHMLDSQLVAGMIMRASYPLGTIHDSFSAPAANAQELYDDTRDVFSIIFEDDVLTEILDQTGSVEYLDVEFKNAKGKMTKVILGNYDISEVLTSEFFTC